MNIEAYDPTQGGTIFPEEGVDIIEEDDEEELTKDDLDYDIIKHYVKQDIYYEL